MSDKDFTKDGGSVDFKEPSSPKLYTKKEKSKYQAFRSDEEDSSDIDELDTNTKPHRKGKKERTNTFKVKIKKSKGKKKEKEKDKEKKKKLKKTSSIGDISPGEYNDEPMHEPIFGVPLDVATERSSLPDKVPLPRIVRECIIYVEDAGLDDEGIYRLSGVKSKVDHLKQLYNEGRPVNLEEYDATTVASLLKLYLRELPSNILTTRLMPLFDSCVSIEDPREQVSRYQQLINDLPCVNRTLLGWLFIHFSHVMEKNSETKMNIQNLSIVFSPTMSISHGVLNLLFTHSKELFPDIKITRYEPPKELSDEKELVMPETMEGLQQLLHQNEEVLADLHDRVNQGGSEDESLMDELWERQRWSTQIKRRIKTLQKAEKEKQKSTDTLDEIDKTPGSVNDLTEGNQEHMDMAKENTDSASRESVTDESTKAVSVEDVTLSVIEVPDEKSQIADAEMVDNRFANFDAIEDKNFANFNETNDFADFSNNELTESSVETSQANQIEVQEVIVPVEDEYDDEYWVLLFEEKKLTIENEELQKYKQLICRKIDGERLEIDRLKDKLREHQDLKEHKQSSTSSSSRNSSGFDGDSNSSESEESNNELETIVYELEEENKALEVQGKELLEKICSERLSCAMIRSELRLLQMTKAMVL